MKTRVALILLLAAGVLAGSSCSTTVIEPGTDTSAVYRFGQLKATVQASIEEVRVAADQAMEELALNVVQGLSDKLEAQIIARDAQDKKVVVELLSVSADTTELIVKTGSMTKARRIYSTILENLPE